MNTFRPVLRAGSLLPCLFGLTAALALASQAQAGLVKTGSWGGDLRMPVFSVRAVAVDSQDRVFVGETGKSRIIRIATDGQPDLSWSVGNLPTSDSKVGNPVDLAIDGNGNVYALDQPGKKVRKYSPDGVLLDQWSADPPYDYRPQGIAVEAGSVWVINDYGVRRYTPGGTLLDTWSGYDSFYDWIEPQIRGDGNGHLMISSGVQTGDFKANKTIYLFQPDGTLISQWTTPAQGWVDYGYDGYDTYEELADIDGFDAIAPTADGNPWTAAGGRIARYNSAGEFGAALDFDRKLFPNALALDSTGDIYYSWTDVKYDQNPGSGVARLDGDLNETGRWTESDFPKYASDTWDGEFASAYGLTARSDGAVGGWDYALRRVELFDREGNYLKRIDGPSPDSHSGETPSPLLPDSGGAQFFFAKSGDIERYSEEGDLLDSVTLEVPGKFKDIALDPDGGYVTVSIVGEKAQITLFDVDGSETSHFEVKPRTKKWPLDDAAVEPGPDGIYLKARQYVEKFSRQGASLATWFAPRWKCERSNSISSIALDFKGNVYALASLPAPEIVRLSGSLVRKWEERVPGTGPRGGIDGDLDVGPGGIYTSGYRDGIQRFDQSKASAKPRHEVCPNPFRLLRIAKNPGRRWAVAVVHVPGSGTLTVKGQKVKTTKRQVSGYGNYGLAIRPKPAFARAGRNRIAKVPFTISFHGRFDAKIRSSARLRLGHR